VRPPGAAASWSAFGAGVDFAVRPGHPPRVSWHQLRIIRPPLSAMLTRPLGDDPDRQVLALRQQVLIFQRQLGKRPRLSRAEKLALLLTCARMKPAQLLDCLMAIKPATLIGWHRQIVRHHWTFVPQRRPGRARTNPQEEQPVLRPARGNTGWGVRQDRRGDAEAISRPQPPDLPTGQGLRAAAVAMGCSDAAWVYLLCHTFESAMRKASPGLTLWMIPLP
jgi:hypothetical protein